MQNWRLAWPGALLEDQRSALALVFAKLVTQLLAELLSFVFSSAVAFHFI